MKPNFQVMFRQKTSSLRGTCTTLTLSKCAYVLAVSINEQISYQKETENDKTHKNTNKTDENDMSKATTNITNNEPRAKTYSFMCAWYSRII